MSTLNERVDRAIKLIDEYQYIDGAHHKQWLLNQVYLALTDGEDALEDKGIAP